MNFTLFEMEGKSELTAPFKCPLTKCSVIVSPSLILSHFLKEHQLDDDPVDFKEIQEKEKVSLMFTMTRDVMELDENVCLGILAYEMKSSRKQHSNAMLSHPFRSYEHHVPIFIMTCRSNYVKMYDKDSDFIDPDADFIAIWLVTPDPAQKNLFVTLTAHNEDCTKSLSSLIRVRSASDSQEVRDFIDTESDFLVINSGFLEEISSNGSILTEISVAENLL